MDKIRLQQELQFVWVIGAIERLASMGYFTSSPFRLESASFETFLELNDKSVLNELFLNDEEIQSVFQTLIRNFPSSHISDSELREMGKLVVDYKRNPERVFRYSPNLRL